MRLILSIRQLNENVEYYDIKMKNINTILNLMTQDCFMTLIDLKNACYGVKISENF